jgi:hypothetical protein
MPGHWVLREMTLAPGAAAEKVASKAVNKTVVKCIVDFLMSCLVFS